VALAAIEAQFYRSHVHQRVVGGLRRLLFVLVRARHRFLVMQFEPPFPPGDDEMNFRDENAEIRIDLFARSHVRTLSKKSLDRESVQDCRRIDRFWPFFGVFRCPVFDSFTRAALLYRKLFGEKKTTNKTLSF